MKTKLKTDDLEFATVPILEPYQSVRKRVIATAKWKGYVDVDESVWDAIGGMDEAKKMLRREFAQFMYGDIREDLIEAVEMYRKGYEFDAIDQIAELISILGGE